MAITGNPEFLRTSGAAGFVRHMPGRIVEQLQVWLERRRYRSDLRRLMKTGTHLVTDIGLLPAHAVREALKPFWQA